MGKCSCCTKLITKKNTILECSRCQKVVHASAMCTGLSNKQLTALRNAENLEWTCNECNSNLSRNKSFMIHADDDDDDEDEAVRSVVDVKFFLAEIKKEVNKIITQELQSLTKAVQFCSTKVEDMAETMDAYTSKLKDMEKKQLQLENKNVHLETRLQALEQHIREMDQLSLSKQVEITGLPETGELDLPQLVENLAEKLNIQRDKVVTVKRIQARKTGTGLVLVELREVSSRNLLVAASRNKNITTGSILPNLDGSSANEKIIIREALTPYNKNLLWQAKQDLKGIFKFVWIREGYILARKNENAKVYKIRTKDDIQSLLAIN